MDILLVVLPESRDLLVIWPDGRAVRIGRDGSTTPPVDWIATAEWRPGMVDGDGRGA
jgi:hypothetical protein